MPYSSKKIELLQEWRRSAHDLHHAKLEEKRLRDEVISSFTHRSFKREGEGIAGTETIEVLNDVYLKIVHRLSYKFGPDKQEVVSTLVRLQEFVPEPIVDRVVIWKPELVISEYNKLPENAKILMRRIMTIEEQAKSVSLVSKTIDEDFLNISDRRK